jgi:hypothetical protein
MTDYTSSYTGPQIDASIAAAQTALQTASIDNLAKLNAIVTDATLVAASAFAAVATTGAYNDLTGTPALGTAAAANTGDFEPSGAVSTHEGAYSHARIPSADQKAALDGANAPAAGNVYATMSDISAAGGGSVTSVSISGSDGIEIDSGSPITASGTIALGINALALQTHLGLDSAAYTPSTDYATAAQGSLADTAVQPGDLHAVATSGDYNDLINTPTGGGSGDMLAATYDPGNVAADVYARANHTGEQAISTVTGLQTALDDKIESTDIDTLAKLNAIVTDATLVDVGADNDWAGQQTFSGGVKEAWTTLSGTTPVLTQGNAVWALSGASTPTDGLVNGESLTLRVTGGDAHTVAWPGTWLGGSAPTLAGNDLIVMWKEGGVLYANYMGAF